MSLAFLSAIPFGTGGLAATWRGDIWPSVVLSVCKLSTITSGQSQINCVVDRKVPDFTARGFENDNLFPVPRSPTPNQSVRYCVLSQGALSCAGINRRPKESSNQPRLILYRSAGP